MRQSVFGGRIPGAVSSEDVLIEGRGAPTTTSRSRRVGSCIASCRELCDKQGSKICTLKPKEGEMPQKGKREQNHGVSIAPGEVTAAIDEEAVHLYREEVLAQERQREEGYSPLPAGAEATWTCRMPDCDGTVRAELRWPPSNPYAPIGPGRSPTRQFVAHYVCDECGVMHAHPPKDVVGE